MESVKKDRNDGTYTLEDLALVLEDGEIPTEGLVVHPINSARGLILYRDYWIENRDLDSVRYASEIAEMLVHLRGVLRYKQVREIYLNWLNNRDDVSEIESWNEFCKSYGLEEYMST